MSHLPIKAVKKPACLAGLTNGKLPSSVLVDIPGIDGGPTVRLVEPAARAWNAMAQTALGDGIVLKATSTMDSFRPYAVQERIFRQRYSTSPTGGKGRRTWNDVVWYQRPLTAAAAVPGTSNHGWALAVDTGTERDGDPGTESIDDRTLDWLLANADRFGFSWELPSEPWHLRYYTGDNIPAAVLEFENAAAPSDDERILLLWA